MSPPKPFPVPDLDDRRFDELVAELQARLARHVPELAPLAPGDPVFALVDLFAWLTETILYRANRIPDRQRQAFLNLLQIPLRPARPASGIVSVDASGFALPLPIPPEALLKAGTTSFSTVGEVQPTPLSLRIVVKRRLDEAALAAEGISLDQLRAQYDVEPAAFRPLTLQPGRDRPSAAGTCDGALHLAICTGQAGPRGAGRARAPGSRRHPAQRRACTRDGARRRARHRPARPQAGVGARMVARAPRMRRRRCGTSRSKSSPTVRRGAQDRRRSPSPAARRGDACARRAPSTLSSLASATRRPSRPPTSARTSSCSGCACPARRSPTSRSATSASTRSK